MKRIRFGLGVAALMLSMACNAHLFTPANQSDQELLSELYLALGVVPPRYDIVTKPVTPNSVEIFSKLFSQPNGQVSRYSIPLLNSALRYWRLDSSSAALLNDQLSHFSLEHKRLVSELDREIEQAQWLLNYHQLGVGDQQQLIERAIRFEPPHREVAIAMLLQHQNSDALTVVSGLKEATLGASVAPQLDEATLRLEFPQYLASLNPAMAITLLEREFDRYEFGSSTFLAYSISRFEWLCALVSEMPYADAGDLLSRLERNPKIERKLQIAARRYFQRWESQLKSLGRELSSSEPILRP